jgi:hypothetical protein
VPISKVQSAILNVIATSRSPDSYVGGGVPLNRRGPRISSDVDIFHGREEEVAAAAKADAALLTKAGYTVQWLRRQPGIHTAEVSSADGSTRLEWVADTDFRFFPPIKDEQFGYVLHPIDVAVYKLVAAASRREPRDIVDLVTIHRAILPLGALALAAAGVVGGFTPEGILEEVSRNARYTHEDFRGLASETPIDGDAVLRSLRAAINEARDFVARMPTDEVGTLFLRDGKPTQPDPDDLSAYVRHVPRKQGHWPTTAEISSAMLAKLQQPDT